MDAFDRATTLINNWPDLERWVVRQAKEGNLSLLVKSVSNRRAWSPLGLKDNNPGIISKGKSICPRKILVPSPRLRGMNWHKSTKWKGVASSMATLGTSLRIAQSTG
ncbi:unnamed protein product [Calypogeia fissa]